MEGCCSTIELHPPDRPAGPHRLVLDLKKPFPVIRPEPGHPALLGRIFGGGGRIRTSVLIRGQIYSLLPLTARPPLHTVIRFLPGRREGCTYGNFRGLVNPKRAG
ncbi:protein of unknown function [Magnetospirillum sp. XM-1]|nr:protein of unknown function [Magnetospirillum sp. XM-1]